MPTNPLFPPGALVPGDVFEFGTAPTDRWGRFIADSYPTADGNGLKIRVRGLRRDGRPNNGPVFTGTIALPEDSVVLVERADPPADRQVSLTQVVEYIRNMDPYDLAPLDGVEAAATIAEAVDLRFGRGPQ